MNVKRKIIISRLITFALGLLSLGIGLLQKKDLLITMGGAMLFATIVQMVRQWKILKNPEKLQELENWYQDERQIFIARKSYSFAFWVTIYAEFVAILVLSYLEMQEINMVLGIVVCAQMLAYALASIFYSKKY